MSHHDFNTFTAEEALKLSLEARNDYNTILRIIRAIRASTKLGHGHLKLHEFVINMKILKHFKNRGFNIMKYKLYVNGKEYYSLHWEPKSFEEVFIDEDKSK